MDRRAARRRRGLHSARAHRRDRSRSGGEPDVNADIRPRVHTGTPDYAAQLTVPTALAFQAAIGAAPRAARLRALRDRWVHAVARPPAGADPDARRSQLHGAITSFRLRGRTSHDDNVALAKALLDKHRIFTVHRDGLASGSCVARHPGARRPA